MFYRIKALFGLNSLYILIVVLISTISVYFSQLFLNRLKMEEQQKVQKIAGATRMLSQNSELGSEDLSFLVDIIQNNTTVPLIVVDKDENIVLHRNLKELKKENDTITERFLLQEMKQHYPPIEILIDKNTTNYIYYSHSTLLKTLQWFPIFQVLLIVVLFSLAYIAAINKNKADRNKLWVGMSRETAHQLGTPISSLFAWIELLKLENIDQSTVNELTKDVDRLDQITQRFSTIGSLPKLNKHSIAPLVKEAVEYMKVRVSKSVIFVENYSDPQEEVCLPLNKTLFFWVIENLIKNAADAIVQKGTIGVNLIIQNNNVIIDISDTGHGIPIESQNKIFRTGYTSKRRGWGLGLSLGKRIVEDYHQGSLQLKSTSEKGTIMRIVLNRAEVKKA